MQIGRYTVGRLLGEGGAGRVYEAVLDGPGRSPLPVALKLLHRNGSSLQREGRLGGLLRHRNLVDVYEVGEHDGTWFCAMERCDGGTLTSRAPLAPSAAVDVALQVCAALAYAHEELGLVHLDLKPDNLLLSGGIVKVADLGIASAEGFEDRRGGTPGFMAPEQLRPNALDPRTDVYALGMTLRALTSRNPPAADTYSWEVEPVAFEADPLPDALEAVLERCTAYSPDDRFASMGELASALRMLDLPGPGLRQTLQPRDADREATPTRTAFVGRADELTALSAAMGTGGLIAVRGPAGVGKTRLVQHALTTWEHASWTCDLAHATDLDSVLFAVARAVGIELSSDGGFEQLGRVLALCGPAVLVLDSVERVPTIQRVRDWLTPSLRIVLTSRHALAGLDELTWMELGPLPALDSVALLQVRALERGAAIEPSPELTALAERLDGIPLALELAAGRIGVLSPAEVLERMTLSLLRSGGDDRHATLRQALDFSWDLLHQGNRDALARLSVFCRDFALDAAGAVLGVDAVAQVDDLVRHSLVSPNESGFALLRVVREYAREHLGPTDAAWLRHGRWFARRGSVDSLRDVSRFGPTWANDIDDLVSAAHAAAARQDVEVASATTTAAAEILRTIGPLSAADALCTTVRASVDDAQLALGHGLVLQQQGRMEEAGVAYGQVSALPGGTDPIVRAVWLRRVSGHGLHTGRSDVGPFIEAAAAADLTGDPWLRSAANYNLAVVRRSDGDYPAARGLLLACLELDRRTGNRRSEGIVLQQLGHVDKLCGQLDSARRNYEHALALHSASGDRRDTASVHDSLSIHLREQGQHGPALAHSELAIADLDAIGARRAAAIARYNRACIYQDLGELERARAEFEVVLQVHRETDNRRSLNITTGNYATLLVRLGETERARELLVDVVRDAAEMGQPLISASYRVNLAELAMDAGEYPLAADHLAAARAVVEPMGDGHQMVRIHSNNAVLAAYEGGDPRPEIALARALVDRLGVSEGSYVLERLHKAEALL